MQKTITIFGSGRSRPGDEVYELAGQVGSLLAEAGYAIATGGYGGTMLAASQAAAKLGGEVIGVTSSAFKKSKPNEFVTREIVTVNLDERLNTLIKLGDGYVVLPGGTGTLLELAMVWEMRNKGFLAEKKKIILVGQFWKPLAGLMAMDDPGSEKYIAVADMPQQIIGLLEK